MIALDTNGTIYAYRKELPDHSRAHRLLSRLANGDEPWALPCPCVYELLRVITHHRVFDPPTDLDKALTGLESLLASPSLVLLGEGPAHVRHLRSTVHGGRATGNTVHDAHIAALAHEHGVRELWTLDGDCARFSGIQTRNPLAAD